VFLVSVFSWSDSFHSPIDPGNLGTFGIEALSLCDDYDLDE